LLLAGLLQEKIHTLIETIETIMTSEQKKFIDDASYETLLCKWRFAPMGDSMFQGEVGAYYTKVMKEKRDKLLPGESAVISKKIGWY
jgi:hypothetical protein